MKTGSYEELAAVVRDLLAEVETSNHRRDVTLKENGLHNLVLSNLSF